jgi:hypothetical protein
VLRQWGEGRAERGCLTGGGEGRTAAGHGLAAQQRSRCVTRQVHGNSAAAFSVQACQSAGAASAPARFPIEPLPRGGAEGGGECEDKASESLPWRGGAQHPLPHRLHPARPPRGGHERERTSATRRGHRRVRHAQARTRQHTHARCRLVRTSALPNQAPPSGGGRRRRMRGQGQREPPLERGGATPAPS